MTKKLRIQNGLPVGKQTGGTEVRDEGVFNTNLFSMFL
jgi:hypothetical protein